MRLEAPVAWRLQHRVMGFALDEVKQRQGQRQGHHAVVEPPSHDLPPIDVEHAEAEVLASGSPAISSLERVRNLLIEIHPAKRLDEIVETIEAHGLRWCGCEHSDGRPALGVNAFRRDEA